MEQSTAPNAEQSSRTMSSQVKGVLSVTIVATLISSFMGSALNLSITNISSEFSSGATTVSWVINVFTIMVAAFSLPFGHLGDITDRRKIFLSGIALFALTNLWCGLAPTIELLIAGRAVQSIASAAIVATNVPVLLSVASPSIRGKLLGLSVSSVYVGLAIGPIIGGILNATLGWRSIFLISFLFLIPAFILGKRFLPKVPASEHVIYDVPGNIIWLAMISSLLVGMSLWNEGIWAKGLVLLGVLLMPLFIFIEKKSPAPTLQVDLFKNDISYTLSNLAALLNYGATFALGFAMSIYLQNVMHLSTSIAGLILVSQPIIMALTSPFAGRLSDRIAPYKLASLGMAIISAGLFIMSTVTEHTSIWFIVLTLALIGSGFGFFSSPNTNAVLSCVGPKQTGEANAVLGTMRSLGMSISMIIVMLIFHSNIGNVVIAQAPAHELVAATRSAMIIFGVICVVGTLISMVRRRAK